MTGKGSIDKHGSSGSEVAGNLGAKFSGNAEVEIGPKNHMIS
jgi:hypothetical protein